MTPELYDRATTMLHRIKRLTSYIKQCDGPYYEEETVYPALLREYYAQCKATAEQELGLLKAEFEAL